MLQKCYTASVHLLLPVCLFCVPVFSDHCPNLFFVKQKNSDTATWCWLHQYFNHSPNTSQAGVVLALAMVCMVLYQAITVGRPMSSAQYHAVKDFILFSKIWRCVQLAPQLLTTLHASDGYPVLDPALLAISIPQLESSLTSKTTSASKSTPSNVTSVPAMTVLSSCPNSGVPISHNDEITVTKPADNKSTWAARNPGWPVMQPHQPLTTMEKEHLSAHTASRQISAAQWKDCDILLNEAIWSLADEFEAKLNYTKYQVATN
ncbi:hypothetical protein F5141DRAFT_1060039 [Pisolithus sp. B1]|nr:hypothetical protein F5141DRAFT_1060039 [Pisolithus sp. B1]